MDGLERQALFERIIEDNAKRIRNIARSNAGESAAQDLEQEILMALWQSLDGYEGRSNFTTWVYAVAINTVRRFKRDKPSPGIAGRSMLGRVVNPANRGLNLSAEAILDEFIRLLDGIDRHVFLMFLDDISYKEMSEAIGIDEANLRKRVSRLKQQFSERYIGS